MTALQGLDRDLAQLHVKLRTMIDQWPSAGLGQVLDEFEREAELVRSRAGRDEVRYVNALVRWMLLREGLVPPVPRPPMREARATAPSARS